MGEKKYVGSIDQGTTSSRFILFDKGGQIVASHQLEHKQYFPRAGWVEHDPLEIWDRTQDVIKETLKKAGAKAEEIASIGITNQRETTIVWDKNTGKPYYNAIVWQDTRTSKTIEELAENGDKDCFREKVGLPLATYFAGPKIKWIMDNVPEAKAAAEKGDAIFGTIDTWVVWCLTGGPKGGSHITDVTNAARTMMMNINTLEWDTDMMKVMEVNPSMLPEIRPSSDPSFSAIPQRTGPLGQKYLWRESLGTSRRHCLVRPVIPPVKQKVPMGRGGSCFLIPERNQCNQSTAY